MSHREYGRDATRSGLRDHNLETNGNAGVLRVVSPRELEAEAVAQWPAYRVNMCLRLDTEMEVPRQNHVRGHGIDRFHIGAQSDTDAQEQSCHVPLLADFPSLGEWCAYIGRIVHESRLNVTAAVVMVGQQGPIVCDPKEDGRETVHIRCA
jgi:hypothetical protein